MALLTRVVGFLSAFVFGSIVALADSGTPAKPNSSQHEEQPMPQFTPWNGSYSDSVEIKVPAFFGLEPNLALDYSSSGGVKSITGANCNLGLGWTLSGVGAIERVSGAQNPIRATEPQGGRGLPRYAYTTNLPADQFVLDGTELFPCSLLSTTTTQVSCAAPVQAGSYAYAPRTENYKRIRFFADASSYPMPFPSNFSWSNIWEVTDHDGTKWIYQGLEGGTHQQTEPPRDCRRRFRLSYAAMGIWSRAA